MKKLSIIIPAYNCEKYIEECIKSITTEINNDIELIIVDDGSKDSTLSICNKYQSDNIRIFSNENHGVSYSRNFGFDKSNGEFIMFVDADDFLSAGWSSVILNDINKSYDVCVYNNKIRKCTMEKSDIIDCILGIDSSIPWIATPWSKVYKKNYLLMNNISFEKDIFNGEDMLFNIQVFAHTNNILLKSENIYNYRICQTSITKSFNRKIFESDMCFQKRLVELLNDTELEADRYSNHCVQNAIIMFVRKLSMIDVTETKNLVNIFEKEPYFTYIKECNTYETKKNKIIIKLLKRKKYIFAIMLMKIFRKIKNGKQTDYIIRI